MDLRQSTAVVIEFGPFLDKADGLALLSGLASAIDHATTGIKLSKNGGTLAVRHATVTASTYDAHGCYKVTLDTTDTATLGTLRVIYTDPTTCLPVWQDFMVLTANAWDSTYGAAVMACNTTQVGGTAQTARDLGAGVLVTAGQLAVKKNVALPSFLFPMFDVSGNLKTGLSVTVAIRLDTAAFHNTVGQRDGDRNHRMVHGGPGHGGHERQCDRVLRHGGGRGPNLHDDRYPGIGDKRDGTEPNTFERSGQRRSRRRLCVGQHGLAADL